MLVEVIIRFRVQFGNNLHKCVFQRVSKFELFDKHTSANYSKLNEKSHDYQLIIFMKKVIWKKFMKKILDSDWLRVVQLKNYL